MASPLVYLVTGANKGIGYETVRILSQRLGEQAVILLGTRSLDNGKAAIAKMQQANPSFNYANVQLLEVDVTKTDSIQAAADFVKTTYGTLHALVNNAGITEHVEGIDACFNVNVYGVYDTLSAFHPIMVPNVSINVVVGSGVGAWTYADMRPDVQAIFDNYNAADMTTWRDLANDWKAAHEGKPSTHDWSSMRKIFGAYGFSKAIILGLVRKWAFDHPDVLTTIVCPGYCATDLNAHSGPRSALQGAESVVYPLFHPKEVKTGGFSRDGEDASFTEAVPAEYVQ